MNLSKEEIRILNELIEDKREKIIETFANIECYEGEVFTNLRKKYIFKINKLKKLSEKLK